MRILLVAIVALALAAPGTAAPSLVQNDAGTGGDAGNWQDHPAPVHNRHGGAHGVYYSEMYRVYDEVDYFSFRVPAGGIASLALAFTAQQDPAVCYSVAPDTAFAATLIAPDGTETTQEIGSCYDVGSIAVTAPQAGVWIAFFRLTHPSSTSVDVGTGPLVVSTPLSTLVHQEYVWGLACDPACARV